MGDEQSCRVHEQQITSLEKRVKIVENNHRELDRSVGDIRVILATNNTLTQQNVKVTEKLDKTLSKMSDNMLSLSEGIIRANNTAEDTNKSLKELSVKQKELDDKTQTNFKKHKDEIECIKRDISENENKNKIDIRDINRNKVSNFIYANKVPIAIIGICVTAISAIIVAIIESV